MIRGDFVSIKTDRIGSLMTKEISYILERLKKEFILERSLMKIYHNLPKNINNDNSDISISKVMKNDLEESKNNLIQSFSNFSSSLNK